MRYASGIQDRDARQLVHARANELEDTIGWAKK
jgi:hypothetical protein